MNDKDGGGADATPMLQYSDKALDLQKQMYEDSVARSEPWYNTGTSAVAQLSKLMGLGGGTAGGARTEAQIRKSLTPQYTSQTTPAAAPATDDTYYRNILAQAYAQGRHNNLSSDEQVAKSMLGRTPAAQPVSTVDNTGLDAAVAKALADQEAANTAAQADPLYGTLARSFTADDYQEDPGYQFRLAEGEKALSRQLNARGKTYSPEAVKALTGYNSDMASQEYGNSYNRFNNDQGNLFNRLATLSGFGQTATGQIQNAGSNYANAGSDLYTGQGNAITAANQANQANRSSMFNTLLGAGAQLGSAYLFSDARLKENIVPSGQENGHNLYAFNYIGEPERYIGVLAQEVLETNPDAVDEVYGYLAVDYNAIGVNMRRVH